MAKRQTKSWAPSWREEQHKGVRAIKHNLTGIVNAAQTTAEAWTVESARMGLDEIRARLEEAEASLSRYEERQAA
jgi:hypothetical protein